MNKLWLLIFLGIGVYQVVSSLLDQMAKKKQEERMREAARERQAGGPGVASPSQQPQPLGRATMGPAAKDNRETLAARRQAQLEQLRRRRAARGGGGGSSTQVRTGAIRPAKPPTPQPQKQIGRAPAPVQQSIKPVPVIRRGQQAHEVERLELLRQRQEQARQSKLREASKRAEHERARRSESRRVVADAPAADNPYALHERATGRRSRIVLGMRHADTLRDLFIMKELLDLPVSLRSEAGNS